MSYMTVNGAVLDKIGSALKEGLDYYGKTQADKATAELARAQAAAAGQPVASDGFPIMTVALLGGAGLLAYMLLSKKKGMTSNPGRRRRRNPGGYDVWVKQAGHWTKMESGLSKSEAEYQAGMYDHAIVKPAGSPRP